jgi:hypothetical protein
MKNDAHPLRVLLKGIILFIVVNVIFALVHPPVGKLSLYNHILPSSRRATFEVVKHL